MGSDLGPRSGNGAPTFMIYALRDPIVASELATVWTDPDLDSAQRTFYYARMIEIPTPCWIVYDAFRCGIESPKGAPTIHQERDYTSPIWHILGS